MEGKNKKIAFHTLGCKLNFSETSSVSRQFSEGGYSVVDFNQAADIYVINSCTVTKSAEKRCRALVRQARKINPEAEIVVTGCYSELRPGDLMEIPGVSVVTGNYEKFRLFEYLSEPRARQSVPVYIRDTESSPDLFIPAWSSGQRTRSFLKIQDGCDYKCSYCTIPLARGRSRSSTIKKTIETAREITRSDIKEVVLTGVNIGDFGKAGGESLAGLLRELVKIDEIERIRLSSVEPDLLYDEIIELVADEEKLMPHFHIPLQSGSDTILGKMRRRYTTSLFASRVEKIRMHLPLACVAADIITGFPGETAELFEESLGFVNGIDLSYLHVFTFSERENTNAMSMPERVDPAERKRRSKKLQSLSALKKQHFIKSVYGLRTKVLWEHESSEGFIYGFTENYIKAKTPYVKGKANTIEEIVLTKTDKNGIYTV